MARKLFLHLPGMVVWLLMFTYPVPALSQPERPSLAEVRDLMATMRVEETMRAITPIIMKQIWDLIEKTAPQIQSEHQKEVQREADQIFLNGLPLFAEILIPVYQKHLTQVEVLALTKFYRTPEGQSTMKKMGIIFKESAEAGRKVGEVVGRRAYEHTVKRLREKGYKL